MVTAAMKLKDTLFIGRKAMTNLDSILKSRSITLWTKFWILKVMVFYSSHVWIWEMDHKESSAPKNWCFWTVVLEKTLDSSLNSKEIQPVNPKGNQSWLFIERTDAVAEAPTLWSPDENWLTENTLMLGKIEGRRKRSARGWDGWMTSLTQ